MKKIIDILLYPIKLIQEKIKERKFNKRLRELKKKDPFIYK